MPTAASFLDEKQSAASFLDEPLESTPPEERPPRGEMLEPPLRPSYSLDEPVPGGKPIVSVEGSTRAMIPASLDVPEPQRVIAPFSADEFSRGDVATPEQRAFNAVQPSEFDRPVIPPGLFKTALDIGSATLPRSEMLEGFKEGAAEQLSGMTSQSSAAMLPAFAIPYVGPALAMGMGAKAVGTGAGTAVAGLEADDPRAVGQGLSEVAGGGLMVAAPLMHGGITRPAILRPVETIIAKTEAAVPGALSKAKAALADTAKREPISDQVQQLETVIEKGVPDEAIQVQEAQGPKEVLSDAARVKEIEAELIHRAARRGRFDAPDPRMEALRAEKLVLEAGREAAQPVAEQLVKGGNKITKETVPERVAVQAEQVMENGETVPGYVTIQSKGNAQSGPVEVWRAAGHEIPDTAGLPSGTYTVAELKARANEKAIPAATEAATPAAADQTQVPTRRAPVVEPRVGAVPENVSGAFDIDAAGQVMGLRPDQIAQAKAEGITSELGLRRIEKNSRTPQDVPAAGAEPISGKSGVVNAQKEKAGEVRLEGVTEPLPEPAGQIKAGEELPVPAETQAVLAENAQTAEVETQGAIATMGPPLMPTPPAGAPAAPVKPISQIIRDLAKGLDLPIRFGRLTTGKYGGYFKKNPNLIGAKLANDMPIVAHEAGHKLDTIYPFTKDTSIFPELDALGDPSIAGSRSSWTPSKSKVYKRSEGLAEFIRHWLTDPAQAQKLAPNTHTLLERVLAANEDLNGTMRQAQADIQLWKNAPQEARLDSSISRSDPNKSRYRLPNLMRDLVDDLHFLRMAVDDAKVSGPLPPSQNPYQLARTLRGSFGMADTFVTKGIVDFKTKEVRPGTDLESALKPVSGRIDEFRRWIVAKRAQELRTQGKESGLNPGDVDFVADKYNSDRAFQEAFTKVKEWNDGLLQYAVDAGLIAPESAARMRELHQDYVPFHRLFEVGAGEAPAVSGGGSGRGLNAGKPGSLKRLTGSQRDIVDPLETMVKNAYTMITAAEKNAINAAVADLAPKSDMGRWVERVAAPKELVKVELERIRKQLEDAGADLANVPDDLLMGFFKPSGRAPFGENIIKVNRGGKQEFYRLDKDLFDTFHALDQDASSRLLKIMSAPAQLLRAGVTLTPDFALSNAIRDTFGAAVNSKYTSYPFQATIRGLGALLDNPKLVSEWAAAGGKQSIEANYFDRAKLQKFVTDRITKDLTPAERAMVVVKSPLTALRKLTGTFEEATRIGEYQAALKQLTAEGMPIGEARRQAAFEARDLQDFAKGGAQTKIVRSLAAFWNAGLQGNIRLAQSFRQRPFQTTLKGLAFITLPKLLEQAVNWNDEDYWDRPQWERDVFFMIPAGKDANGHTRFVRIPTPFEMGIIFGTVPGRVLQSLREKNPEAVKDLPKVMLRQTIPNPTPQAALTLLEVNAGKGGYSFFRDRPIVPSSLQNAPPEMQFTSQNSLTAKKVGDLIGVSPAKVDYAIAGLTGGVGRQLTHQVSDRAISAVTGDARTAESTMPGARFVATPAGTQSEAVERFYKALEEANADAERVKAGLPSQGTARNAPRLNAVARAISDLRKEARMEKDPVKRQAINLQLVERARNAFKPTPNPNP